MEIGSVIRTANERAGRDMIETFVPGNVSIEIKLFGRDVFDNGEMIRGRSQLLSHGQDLAADLA